MFCSRKQSGHMKSYSSRMFKLLAKHVWLNRGMESEDEIKPFKSCYLKVSRFPQTWASHKSYTHLKKIWISKTMLRSATSTYVIGFFPWKSPSHLTTHTNPAHRKYRPAPLHDSSEWAKLGLFMFQHHGLTCVLLPPKFICRSPNPQYLRMLPYVEIGPLKGYLSYKEVLKL